MNLERNMRNIFGHAFFAAAITNKNKLKTKDWALFLHAVVTS